MPHPADNSEQPSTLPPAELNPMLNPVLGRNMGRWAEVYYTNPPEKREQAVLELLRELEAGETTRDWSPGSFRSEATPAFPDSLDPHRARLDDDDRPFAGASGNDWHRYRSYAWVLLAVVLLVFAAATWRGRSRPSSQQSSTAPIAAAPVAKNPQMGGPGISGERADPQHIATAAPPVASPVARKAAVSPKPQPAASPGSTELTMAQNYLKGANGQERNSAEAATWLWKAVGKRNADATLLLADLYLKGDGVSKNCDQARVLLDAAAQKGKTGAAERLRHLQAFGCE